MSGDHEIMMPAHPRWDEFCDRLGQTLDAHHGRLHGGCNGCGQPDAHEGAIAILATMELDVGGSIRFFYEHGGHCDCEILMNVDEDDDDDDEDGPEP